MNREDIIRMAQEADVWVVEQEPYQSQLERFAALVAAAERVRMCKQFNIPEELAHEKTTGNETN